MCVFFILETDIKYVYVVIKHLCKIHVLYVLFGELKGYNVLSLKFTLFLYVLSRTLRLKKEKIKLSFEIVIL